MCFKVFLVLELEKFKKSHRVKVDEHGHLIWHRDLDFGVVADDELHGVGLQLGSSPEEVGKKVELNGIGH